MQYWYAAIAILIAFVHLKECNAAANLTWVGLYEIGEHHVEHWSEGDIHDEHEEDNHDDDDDEEPYHMFTVAFFPNNGSAFTQETVRFGCGLLTEHEEDDEEEDHDEEDEDHDDEDEHDHDHHMVYSVHHHEMEEELEEFVLFNLNTTAKYIEFGDTITCGENRTVYEVALNTTSVWAFHASINFTTAGDYVIAMDVSPSEFADPAMLACAAEVLEASESSDEVDDGHGHRRLLASTTRRSRRLEEEDDDEHEHEEENKKALVPPGGYGGSEVFLRNEEGTFMAPIYDSDVPGWEHEDHDEGKQWIALLGAAVSSLPSLVAILCVIPFIVTVDEKDNRAGFQAYAMANKLFINLDPQIVGMGNAFAMGTLSAAAVFLVLPEGLHMIESKGDSESESAAVWGSMLLLAFFICHLLHAADALIKTAKAFLTGEAVESTDVGVEMVGENGKNETGIVDKTGSDSVVSLTDMSRWSEVVPMIIIGDFLHNFSDGIFIVSAFSCGNSFGWTVVGITIAHEFPQEIGDFMVLITTGGMSVMQAVLVNFLSGWSAIFGALIFILAEPSEFSAGCALVFGGGIYLFTALHELSRKLYDHATATQLLMRMFAYVCGAVAIGLILLDHEHCDAH